MRSRLLCGAFLCGSLLLSAIGCADPEGEFDNFGERWQMIDRTSSSSGMMMCTPPAVGEADGSFFTTLSLSPAPTKPIVFLTSVETANGREGLELSFSLQPLLADDRTTPVGEPFVLNAVVADDGAFLTVPIDITLVDAANPILSQDQKATGLTLTGSLCAASNFVCGGAYAETPGLPVGLRGSTFTMVRVAELTGYPEPPPINCEGELADPL